MRPVLKQIQNSEIMAQENAQEVSMPAAALFGGVTLIILLFGLTMLYSTSFGTAGSAFFVKQLMWAFIGGIGVCGVIFFGFKKVSDWSPWLMVGIFLLLVIADFCFPAVNGAHRWIKVPGIGNIQPSEYSKVILTLFLAKFLSERIRYIERAPFWRVFVAGGCLCGPVILFVLIGRDLGTTTLLTLLFFAMMFIAGISWKIVLPILLSMGGCVFSLVMAFDPMRRDRLTIFLNPEPYQVEEGYQLWNSMLALGSGGWTGLGFTESRMKMKYLPEAHTDFILSIVGEELGLVFMLLVIVAYIAFVVLAMVIARNARTRQGMLVAFGCATFIGIQAIINIGVICGAFPTKGMPAPFISYGGSSLVTCLVAAGLILSVAVDSAYPDYQILLREKLRGKLKILMFWKQNAADMKLEK